MHSGLYKLSTRLENHVYWGTSMVLPSASGWTIIIVGKSHEAATSNGILAQWRQSHPESSST